MKLEVERAISSEELTHLNWYEDRAPRADEVGIVQVGNSWRVYSTDERANARYDTNYENEETALADFLPRLRATNRYFAMREGRSRD